MKEPKHYGSHKELCHYKQKHAQSQQYRPEN